VMFGIGLSLPIVVWGAGLLAHLMNRFAWIVWLGGGVLGYVAGEMFMEDPIVKRGLGETASALHYPVPVVVGLVITASGWWFAREVSVESLIEPLALVMASHREAIGELFEARRLLEPAIAALAARRATPDELAEMERILEDQAKAIAAGKTGLTQDAAFHAAIGAAAHNGAITRIAHAVMDLLTQSREESLNTPGRPDRSHQDHRRILTAIHARDERAAQRAMLDHLEAVEGLVLGRETGGGGRQKPS